MEGKTNYLTSYVLKQFFFKDVCMCLWSKYSLLKCLFFTFQFYVQFTSYFKHIVQFFLCFKMFIKFRMPFNNSDNRVWQKNKSFLVTSYLKKPVLCRTYHERVPPFHHPPLVIDNKLWLRGQPVFQDSFVQFQSWYLNTGVAIYSSVGCFTMMYQLNKQ